MKFSTALVLMAIVCSCYSWPMRIIKQREFNLHEAMGYAADRESMRKDLEEASLEEVKDFFKSVHEDILAIEALGQKITNHDWSTLLELSAEEQELISHLIMMDSYMPSVGGFGTSLFIDACQEEYMKIDFSQFATLWDAKMEAINQFMTCGNNGFRELEKVLDISNITEKDLECIDTIVQKIDRLARGLAEMFTLSRGIMAIIHLDERDYPNPATYNQALKQDIFLTFGHGGSDDDKPNPKPDDIDNPKPGPNNGNFKPSDGLKPDSKPGGNNGNFKPSDGLKPQPKPDMLRSNQIQARDHMTVQARRDEMNKTEMKLILDKVIKALQALKAWKSDKKRK